MPRKAKVAPRGIELEPRQGLAFTTTAAEVLYGGAAGGGKSYLLRASAIRWCIEIPGIQVYLFRRTLPDLRDNHLRGPTSFHVMLDGFTSTGKVKYRSVENEFEFWNGSILHLCYCDSENDVEKYRGAEIHVLIIDELTHFSEYQYRFLRSRVRIAGLKVPEKHKSRLPRIECASNPGSIGHAWVKRTFITPKPANEIWRVPPEEGGMVRQFIPAKLMDNPYLWRDDPTYADRLRGLGSDHLVRAMLEGDWDLIAGQAFEKLRRDTHCIEAFEPPEDWMIFGSLDWGSTKPFSFGLWTVSNGNPLPDGRTYRRGAIIRYNEIYGWNGKPDEGMRREAGDVADLVKTRIAQRKPAYISADPSMWKVDGGPSLAENFLKHGVNLRKADNSRIVGYLQLRQRIAGDEEGPMLYATKNCHDGFWRTMPDIVMDERHVEDIDCWIAGTLISTPGGGVPIENVGVGDLVNTPIGARRVLKSYVSGPSATMRVVLESGEELCGTPHHKVYVDGVGLVPLESVKSGDTLIKRNTVWKERELFTRVLLSDKTARMDTLRHGWRYIALCGLTLTEQFQKAIISTIKTMTEWTIGSRTLNAYQPVPMLYTTTSTAQTCETSKRSGPLAQSANQHSEQTCKKHDPLLRGGHLRAGIVESLLSLATQPKSSALLNARFSKTGGLHIAPFAPKNSNSKDTLPNRSGLVRIVAVGRCEEKTPVYNLTVDQAHLFYANGILSSNTDQEDHCADDCRYACMSRPWMMSVKDKKAPVDRWMKAFERETSESRDWRTV